MQAVVPVKEDFDHFLWLGQSGAAYHKTFRLAAWPPQGIEVMWIEMMRADLMFRVKSAFWPSVFQVTGGLRRKINRLETNLEMSTQEGDTNALPRDDELRDYRKILTLRNAMLYQHETLTDEETFVTLSSPDKETLAADCNKFLDIANSYGVLAVAVNGEQAPGALFTTLMGKAKLKVLEHWNRWTMVPKRAAAIIPRGVGFAGDGQGVYVGHILGTKSPVQLDLLAGKDGFASNAVIFGMTGSGKSYWMKAILYDMYTKGVWIIIFDIDGEYRSLCENLGGLWIDLSGESGRFPDPCLIPGVTGLADEDSTRYSRMRSAIGRVFTLMGDLNDLELTSVEKAVAKVYGQAGIIEHKPETWDKPHSITMRQIYDECDETVKTKCWRGFEGGLSGYFSDPIKMDTQPNRLVVFHLGNPDIVSSPKVAAIKFSMAIDTSWEWLRQNRKLGRNTVVDSDEGQRTITKPVIGNYFANLMTTIRKWNGVMLFATNTPSQLWTTDLGNQIWGNTPVKVIFALESDQIDKLTKVITLPAGVETAIRKQFGTHIACIRDRGGHWVQVRVDIPPEEAALYKTRG
ncbi:AAA-like domain protein [Peptococcaceae bacterium CEB3]|nr:AAA-like domain protein [Peptococcaceae bacterium CEB3]